MFSHFYLWCTFFPSGFKISEFRIKLTVSGVSLIDTLPLTTLSPLHLSLGLACKFSTMLACFLANSATTQGSRQCRYTFCDIAISRSRQLALRLWFSSLLRAFPLGFVPQSLCGTKNSAVQTKITHHYTSIQMA